MKSNAWAMRWDGPFLATDAQHRSRARGQFLNQGFASNSNSVRFSGVSLHLSSICFIHLFTSPSFQQNMLRDLRVDVALEGTAVFTAAREKIGIAFRERSEYNRAESEYKEVYEHQDYDDPACWNSSCGRSHTLVLQDLQPRPSPRVTTVEAESGRALTSFFDGLRPIAHFAKATRSEPRIAPPCREQETESTL